MWEAAGVPGMMGSAGAAGAAGLRGSAGTHVRRPLHAVRYGTGSHRANLPARTFVSYHRGCEPRRPHAHSHPRRPARYRGAREREHLRHDRVSRAASGHSSAARADLEPHAHQDCHRDADHAEALQYAPADRGRAAAHPQPRGQERLARASRDVLPHVRRGARRALRRADHHRRPGREARFRGRRLLGRARGDHGLVHHQCSLHAAYLLGRAGGSVPSLRDRQARAARQTLGGVRAPSGKAELAARPRPGRSLLCRPLALYRR